MRANAIAKNISDRLRDVVLEQPRYQALSPWLNRVSLSQRDSNLLVISLNDTALQDLFTEDIQLLLQEAVRETNENSTALRIETTNSFSLESQQPNPALRFDTFYTGASNKLAFAAAQAITHPSEHTYNPLVIHAGVGLGKTHLLNAISHLLSDTHNKKSVLFVSASYFIHSMLRAIEMNQIALFRNAVMEYNALFVDDFHAFADHPTCQTEFLFLFKEFMHAKRQVILTSAYTPALIPNIIPSLSSRLQWGLVVDIASPTVAMRRVMILNKLKHSSAFTLADDVVEFLAKHTFGPIRELEGILNTLRSRVTFLHEDISLAYVQQLLFGCQRNLHRTITLDQIECFITKHFSLSHEDMFGKSRIRSIAYPRQICMFLAQTMTSCSLEEIGRHFGGRDHSTVKHGCDKIHGLIQNDNSLRSLVADFRKSVSSHC